MDILIPILIAAAVIAVVSIIIGVLLGVLSEKFKVEENEKVSAVCECLAGSNCGACGYAGCDAYAEAVVLKGESPTLCNAANIKKIGEIMGLNLENYKKTAAFVACSGSCARTVAEYEYFDELDCRVAYLAPKHGAKSCRYACCGLGTCAAVCPYDAIRIVDGLAIIDQTKCKACGKCVGVCPNNLISLRPVEGVYGVRCSSNAKGKEVTKGCQSGCIGCGICVKNCEFGAITMENNLAHIDPEKCTGCGKCAEKCPRKVIAPLEL